MQPPRSPTPLARHRHTFFGVLQAAAYGELASQVAEEREAEEKLLNHRLVRREVYAHACEPHTALIEFFVLPGVADQLYVHPKAQNKLGYGAAPCNGE